MKTQNLKYGDHFQHVGEKSQVIALLLGVVCDSPGGMFAHSKCSIKVRWCHSALTTRDSLLTTARPWRSLPPWHCLAMPWISLSERPGRGREPQNQSPRHTLGATPSLSLLWFYELSVDNIPDTVPRPAHESLAHLGPLIP
jgi:hypothetical protein